MNTGDMYHFDGASGRRYLFTRLNPNALSPIVLAHGVYILGRDDAGAITPLYIGEADSVYAEITGTTKWNEAKLRHGADAMFFWLLKDPVARAEAKHDLVAQHHPPLN
jgi:hypothetical protein